MARFWKLLVLICFMIIADQLTKGWTQSYFKFQGQTLPIIDGFFSFTYVHNRGAAFGFMNTAPEIYRQLMFLLVPTIFSGWVGWMLVTTIKGPFHLSLAYALILAGAIGNLIDRFSLGYVVDFILFYYKEHDFPAFNIADSCITIAAVLLGWDVIWQYRQKKAAEKSNPPSVTP